jgi:hypothetical protein
MRSCLHPIIDGDEVPDPSVQVVQYGVNFMRTRSVLIKRCLFSFQGIDFAVNSSINRKQVRK